VSQKKKYPLKIIWHARKESCENKEKKAGLTVENGYLFGYIQKAREVNAKVDSESKKRELSQTRG